MTSSTGFKTGTINAGIRIVNNIEAVINLFILTLPFKVFELLYHLKNKKSSKY